MINVFITKPLEYDAEVKKIRESMRKGLKFFFPDSKDSNAFRHMKDAVFLSLNTGGISTFAWDKVSQTATREEYLTPFLLRIDTMCANSDDVFLLLGSFGTDVFFKDVLCNKDLPDKFYRLSSFTDPDVVLSYLKFSLFSDKFEKIRRIEQGKMVYRQKDTGNYWYEDNFHKEYKRHYEVFDKHCKHLGEASMDGIIDYDKAVPGRTIQL